MEFEKIKNRIRKLLNMADDTSSPNEAAIAAERARKLMEQYQIDHVDVVMEELDDPDQLIYCETGKSYRKVPGWMQSLAVSVARASECQVKLTFSGQTKKGKLMYRIRFEGYKPDVELCEWLFNYLCQQIDQQTKAERKLNKRFPADAYVQSPRRYLRSFRDGMSAGVRSKLSEFYKQNDERVSDTARALVSAKSNAIAGKFGRATYTSGKYRSRDRSGYGAGQTASKNVNVSKGISGSRANAGPKLLS